MASFSFDYAESDEWVWAYGHKDDGGVYAIHISGGGDPSTPNGFEDWVIKCDKKGDLTYYIRHGVPDADKLQKGRILVSSPDQHYISWQDKDYAFREGEWSFIGVQDYPGQKKDGWQIGMEEEDEQRDAETQLAEEVEHLKMKLEEVKEENKELKEELDVWVNPTGEVVMNQEGTMLYEATKEENKELKEENETLKGDLKKLSCLAERIIEDLEDQLKGGEDSE